MCVEKIHVVMLLCDWSNARVHVHYTHLYVTKRWVCKLFCLHFIICALKAAHSCAIWVSWHHLDLPNLLWQRHVQFFSSTQTTRCPWYCKGILTYSTTEIPLQKLYKKGICILTQYRRINHQYLNSKNNVTIDDNIISNRRNW